jgi:hypothetical protein
MSERVSDETLRYWMTLDPYTFHLSSAASELLERRAADELNLARDSELRQWRALGESPEAVRARMSALEAIEITYHKMTKPSTARPTALEALEDVFKRHYLASETVTAERMIASIRAARRAAGEVL